MRKLNNKGFSLVEILIAIALLAVLMTIASQAYNTYKKQARQQAYDTMAKSATVAATNYLMENDKAKYISFETLKDTQYVDTLQDPRYKDKECTGIVINKVMPGENQKQLDVLFQKVKLCCKNYKYQYDYTGDDVNITEIDSCEYVEGDEIAGVYKLIYKPQGGTECNPAVVKKTQFEEWGQLCITTKEGSVFKGWNTKKNGSGSIITEHTKVGDKDINVYAIWNPIYTLTFNEDGGTACNPKSINKENGEKWGLLCTTSKTGYAFKGWFSSKNGQGSKITNDTYAEKNITAYAHWNPIYTLTFDSNGGKACSSNSITKENGDEWGDLCVPTREGHTFVEWKDANGKTVKSTTKASKSLTVTAVWRQNCPDGYTYQSGDGTCKKVYNATEKYSCNSGDTLSETTCTNKLTYDANVSYTCSSGTLSGTSCITTTSKNASSSYKCNNGGTLSGSRCEKTTTTSATIKLEYTSCSWTKDGGHWSSSKPSGVIYSSSRPSCNSSNRGITRKVYDCNPGKACRYSSGSYNCKDPCGGVKTGYGYKIHTCSCKAKETYTCSSGTLSGTSCISTTYTNATIVYSCSSGYTLNGTKCEKKTSTSANKNYSCNSGDVLSGTNCTKTSTYAATKYYVCNSGDTLNGTTCTSVVTP